MSKPPGGPLEKDSQEGATRVSTLSFSTVKGSLQESSEDFMQYVRTTLQQAQEITDVVGLVERFDRRGTEPFELFRSEFGQHSWNPKKTTVSICQN